MKIVNLNVRSIFVLFNKFKELCLHLIQTLKHQLQNLVLPMITYSILINI